MTYHIDFHAASVEDAIHHLETEHAHVSQAIIDKLKAGLSSIQHDMHGVHVFASGHLASGSDHSTSEGSFKIRPITFIRNLVKKVEEEFHPE